MSLDGKRILLVEDEALVLLTLEDILTELGCEIAGSAATLDEAVSAAAGLSCDAAILDVNLRGQLVFPAADLLARRAVPFFWSRATTQGAVFAIVLGLATWGILLLAGLGEVFPPQLAGFFMAAVGMVIGSLGPQRLIRNQHGAHHHLAGVEGRAGEQRA